MITRMLRIIYESKLTMFEYFKGAVEVHPHGGSMFVPYEQALAAWEGMYHKRMTFYLNQAGLGVNAGMCSMCS